ncbi:MAG: hypothetical protein EOP83_20885 [Verrucomicrobiaceae bacterium]|nr:MAG: hypothetical protein EOP83_20885 [Verrucomicrobiaceae bacterium]
MPALALKPPLRVDLDLITLDWLDDYTKTYRFALGTMPRNIHTANALYVGKQFDQAMESVTLFGYQLTLKFSGDVTAERLMAMATAVFVADGIEMYLRLMETEHEHDTSFGQDQHYVYTNLIYRRDR